jgi:hypothetical protein
MKRTLLAASISALLLAVAAPAQAQMSFDVEMGPPPGAPRAYRVPPQPGPDYVWVDGYWYPANGQYRWHDGYWTRPPYPDAYWVAPYYQRGQYYTGYWEGGRGAVHHYHGWDQSRQRDESWRYRDGNSNGGRPSSYDSNAPVTRAQAEAVVRSAYENVLRREPDPGSVGYVDRVFRDHWSQQQIENELRNSAEYRQRFQGR